MHVFTSFAARAALPLFLAACADPGSGLQPIKVVPNESAEPELETTATLEPASRASLRQLEAILPQDDPSETEPQDLRGMTPETRRQAADRFRRQQLRPLSPPTTGPARHGWDPTPLPASLPTQAPANQPTKTNPPSKPDPFSGGGRFSQAGPIRDPEQREEHRNLPPGRFLNARLVGTLSVSLFSPVVWAEILDGSGKVIGTAVGSATLHRALRDRALLRFSKVHLHDGRTLQGSFEAFDLDLAQGLRGRLERRLFKKFALALANTLLGALSLEVDTGTDSFANYFRFQLASRLLDQGRQELQGLELSRLVHLPRGTRFRLASTRDASVRAEGAYPAALTALGATAREAFRDSVQTLDQPQRQAFEEAYRRLEDRLRTLP